MGGIGSGRGLWVDTKITTGSLKRIDIRWLRKQGYLNISGPGWLSWTCNGEASGNINYVMNPDHMTLNFRYRVNGGPREDVTQTIRFDNTTCNYGGFRKWFQCPRCMKRVEILYLGGKYFLCRHCYGLTYRSQQEVFRDRMLSKAEKIKERLGVTHHLAPIIFKPKGMHWKTFNRLRRIAEAGERIWWEESFRIMGMEI